MFSLWTGVFFHHCAPLSSWSDRTYPAAFSRSAARGESVGSRYPWREDYTKWRWGRQSDWCHPRVRGAVFYHLQCLRVKPQGAGHIPPEQDQGNVPVSFNTYRRCGSLRRKSHRGDSALQTSGIWELPDKILSALYFCVVFFFFLFPPVCHQSLVSAASLQWKGEKRITDTARMLERGVQTHQCPWAWRLDDPYSFLFFTGRMQSTEVEVRAVIPPEQKQSAVLISTPLMIW